MQSRESGEALDFVILNLPNRAAYLFRDWKETLIWSCLQGIMGCVYSDRQEHPESAAALLGDFCFLAGKPSQAFLYRLLKHVHREYLIIVPQTDIWGAMVEEQLEGNAERITRYATRKDTNFNQRSLRVMVQAVPDGMELKKIDQSLFEMVRKIPWCRDWVRQYENYDAFREKGKGVVLMRDGEPISGASAYSRYDNGIEIEIDTREDCRRQGLARICAAELILQCLECGLYPSWDAHNEASLALAEQLGYVFDHSYIAYEAVLEER